MPALPSCRGGALTVLVALAAVTAPAALAQAPLPIDPQAGRYRRELREIERRAVTDPGAAARQAAATRRRLVGESGGVAFTPERARIDRELGRLESAPPAPDRPPAPPAADGGPELPSSFSDDSETLPSLTREIRLVTRLLDRAARGLEAGDAPSVGSDLATARASLAGLRPAAPAAEIEPLATRLEGLEQRLAGLPPGDGGAAAID
jgi:hypothetical protein